MVHRKLSSVHFSNRVNKKVRRQAVHWAEGIEGSSLTDVILLDDPPSSCMSYEEKSNRWYQRHEIRKLNQYNASLLSEFYGSIYGSQPMAMAENEALQFGHSFRGLERYELAGIRYRTSFAANSRKRVIQEQHIIQQRRFSESTSMLDRDFDYISKVYFEDTTLHRDLARIRALQDEEYVNRLNSWGKGEQMDGQLSSDNVKQVFHPSLFVQHVAA